MSSMQMEPQELHWRKAMRSIANGDCVEVASGNGMAFVRDSKNPCGTTLKYPVSSWREFIATARAGHIY